MKKLNFILGILLIALVGFITSCEKDEDAIGPSLVLTAGGDNITADATVIPGATLNFAWEARKGDANLATFSITRDGIALQGWDEYDIPSSVNDIFIESEELIAPLNEGAYLYIFTVVDKDGLTANVSVTITVEGDADLSAASELILVYKGSSQSDGENISDDLGIEYASNINANTAQFDVIATAGNVFVMLSETEANAITTQGELMTAYDDGAATGVDNFQVQSDALFQDVWFATKVGDIYYWVHMTDLTFAAGNNQAYFDYKQ